MPDDERDEPPTFTSDLHSKPINATGPTGVGPVALERNDFLGQLDLSSDDDGVTFSEPHECEDPFSKDYRNRAIADTVADPKLRDIFYSFLLSMPVSKMRGPAGPLKKQGIPQQLNKQAMTAALFHVAAKRVADGGGRVSFDDGLVFDRGDASRWYTSSRRQGIFDLRVAPTDTLLSLYAPSRTSRGKSKSEIRTVCAALTVNEFARLVGFLVVDGPVRAALLKSGLDLTHSDLDSRAHRDDFWIHIVEQIMNDVSQRVTLPGRHLSPCLANVNPNIPVVQFRSGDFLKRKFYDSRASFTQWRMN
jgi:hypothetical protein